MAALCVLSLLDCELLGATWPSLSSHPQGLAKASCILRAQRRMLDYLRGGKHHYLYTLAS